MSDLEKKYFFKNKSNHLILIIGSVVLFFITAVIAIYFPLITTSITEVVTSATSVNHEPFTEIYFDKHTELPTIVIPLKQYNFKFTIHNLENKTMNYVYEVYLNTNDGKLSIDKGSTTMKNHEYKTFEEGFSINGHLTKDEIVVKLINKNQQIDFWIEGAK